jgi:subtilisin family serine protease
MHGSYRRLLFACGALVLSSAALSQVVEIRNGIQVRHLYVPNEVIVQFKEGAPEAARERVYRMVDTQAREHIYTSAMRNAGHRGIVVLQTPRSVQQSIATLQSDPAVEFAEPNWIYTTGNSNDPSYVSGNLWGMYGSATSPRNQFGSNAGGAWLRGAVGNSSVVVGVIDEGIQVDHVDLAANIWINPLDPIDGVDNDGNGYIDDTHGWDFANNDRTVYDGGTRGSLDKHGTHVAGTIGALGNNGTGVAGVCWNVKMISGKFLGRFGGTTANAVRAVDYFTDLKVRHQIDIVATNNSWGGGGYSQALFNAIVRGADQDILFIAAAGNGGSDGVGDNNDLYAVYPACYNTTTAAGYDAVIAVASITSTGARSSFSNFGPTTVELGAPGSSINSTLPYNKYGAYSGTSMATPHVSGAAALFRSRNPSATAEQVRQGILSSTTATTSLNGITMTNGRLNVGGF